MDNNSNVLDSISAELREKEKVQQLPAIVDHHRTLGLHWDTAADAMHVATPSTGSKDPHTIGVSGICKVVRPGSGCGHLVMCATRC